MEKVKVSVFVAGQRFNIITDEEEKYVRDLAARVDGRINSLAVSQNIGRERAAVLAALDLADDIDHERRNLSEVKEQVKDYLTQIEKLSAENCRIKNELGSAESDAKELKAAREILSKRDKEISALKSEIFSLKDQIELMRKTHEEALAAKAIEDKKAEEVIYCRSEDKAPTEEAPAVQEAPPEKAGEITAQDDLFFDMPEEEPVKPSPRKEKKNRHDHSHVNPYKQNYLKKQEDQKGYTQQRQISLFDADGQN